MSGNLVSQSDVSQYVNWMNTHGYSARTFNEYAADLEKLMTWAATHSHPLDTWDAVNTTAAQWLAAHTSEWKPNTVRRRMAAVRGFGKFNNQPLLHDYRAPKPLPPKAHPIDEGRSGVIAMCEASKSAKQAALCALTGVAGLRINEAISVRISDIDAANKLLVVRGKGAKLREVPISPTAWKYIEPAMKRATRLGWDVVCPYSNSGARRSIEIQGRRAGLGNAVASHDMRSTFLTDVYARTKDIRATQLLAGHSQITTTQNYIGVTEDRLREAAGE